MERKRSEVGIASVVFVLSMLTILSTVYVMYQAYGVPGYCKQAEGRMLTDFIEAAKNLAETQKKVIAYDVEAATHVRTQYQYPSIPFFTTPAYASVSATPYDISVTIENVASDEVDISSVISLKGKAVELSFDPVFSTPVKAFVELGIVATDGSLIEGSVYTNGSIFLPFFEGMSFTNQLTPVSGGGKGILVKPRDPTKNITIKIIGSRIPERVWEDYATKYGLSITYTSSEVVIELPPNNYVLRSGVASFTVGAKPYSPTYLKALSHTVQRSPAVIELEVLDEYFNPTPTTVNVTCIQGCPIDFCTPDASGLKCQTTTSTNVTGDTVSFRVEKASGTSVVVTSINRLVGGPYQLAFVIQGS